MIKKRLIDWPKEIFKVPILERLLASLTQNKKPSHLLARLPPLYLSYPKNSFRIVNRNSINYELDISDYMEWLVYYGIRVESHDILYGLLTFGNVVFDIGANVGEVTLNMSKVVGSAGVVHSFEPDPFIFSKLEKNCCLNHFANIHLNNVALGDNKAELMLAPQVEHNRGGTRIQRDSSKGQKVKVTTIDSYLSNNRTLQKIDLIKVDVEGFELKVLKGAIKTLKEFKPKLFIEVNDNNLKDQGDSASSLIKFLYEIGYMQIEHAENRTTLSESTNFHNCHFDIIAG